jgi:hypothetical protein
MAPVRGIPASSSVMTLGLAACTRLETNKESKTAP